HELPLTPNGKIDRRALPKANENDTDQQKRYVRPRDLLEAQLFSIWQEVLGVEQLSILDNFFDLGGHSLLAIGLMSRIQAVLGRDLALSVLFQYPTISEMAAFLRQEAHEDKGSIVVPIQPLGSKTPFFCMPPLGGTFFRYYSLAQRLGTDRPFYGMRLPDLGTYTSIEDLAACYITAIQAIQPQGPYLLGGWSLGGVIAFEMARQLWKQGQETALLAPIDSVLPNFPDTPPREVGELDMSDPALARMMLEHIAAIQTEEALNQYEPEEQFRYVVEKLKEFGLWTPDVGIDQARYIMRTIAMNIHVLQAYIPQTYPGHLTLFRAKEGITEAEPGQGQDAIPRYRTLVRGWETVVTGGIDVHVVSGNHSSMLDEPHVRVLASLLKDCINKACARSV